jgi:hypothetical protein
VVTGQFLYSSTQNPNLPEVFPTFLGQKFDSYAGTVTWDRQKTRYDWRFRYNDYGDEFRADTGFVPQVGFREGLVAGGLRFFPTGNLFNFIRIYGAIDKFFLQDGGNLGHDYFPGIFFQGTRNLTGQFEFHDNEIRLQDQLLPQKYLTYFLQIDPSRKFPRITIQGRVGDLIDFENVRVGNGTNFSVEATVRPTSHLTLVADARMARSGFGPSLYGRYCSIESSVCIQLAIFFEIDRTICNHSKKSGPLYI